MKQTAFNEIRGSERWDIVNLYDFQVHKFIRMYIYSRVREITRSQFLSLEPSPICTLSDVTGTGSKGCPRLNQTFISLTVLFENGDDFKLLRVVHTGRALFKSYSRINHVSSKFALEERHSIILKHVWSIVTVYRKIIFNYLETFIDTISMKNIIIFSTIFNYNFSFSSSNVYPCMLFEN